MIQQCALPRRSAGLWGNFVERLDILKLVDLVGATGWRALVRDSSILWVASDGNEARFWVLSPGSDGLEDLLEFPRLSAFWRSEGSEYPEIRVREFEVVTPPPEDLLRLTPDLRRLIAPWRDAEMLGQAALDIFRMVELGGHPANGALLGPRRVTRRVTLHRSAQEGDPGSLPRRLRDADPEDSEGMTPLLLAAGEGHAPFVGRLLELGADHTHCDHRGRTSLHYAAKGGSAEAVRAFVGAGATIDARDAWGRTPLHDAAASGALASLESLLVFVADPNVADTYHQSAPLHLAARSGHARLVVPLVSAGADINQTNADGRTPLHVATAYGRPAVVAALLEAGANPAMGDSIGWTPMHCAAFFDHQDCLARLVERGAALDAVDENGNTPLHLAASMNRDGAAAMLLEAGALLEARNAEGLTPMDMAIVNAHFGGGASYFFREHNTETAAVLVQHGASIDPKRLPVGDRHVMWPHLTPPEYLTPTLDLDEERLPDIPAEARQMIRDLHRKHGRDLQQGYVVYQANSLLSEAVLKNRLDLMEALLDAGASTETGIRRAYTPLHMAAATGNIPAVEQLLEHGADLEIPFTNSRDAFYDVQGHGRYGSFQETPLDSAIFFGRAAMTGFLLDRGAVPPVSRDDVWHRRFEGTMNRWGRTREGLPDHPLEVCPEGKRAEVIAVFEERGLLV